MAEIETILGNGSVTCYQIAAQMTWRARGGWTGLALFQRRTATTETLAHLKFMVSVDRLGSAMGEDGLKRYHRAQAPVTQGPRQGESKPIRLRYPLMKGTRASAGLDLEANNGAGSDPALLDLELREIGGQDAWVMLPVIRDAVIHRSGRRGQDLLFGFVGLYHWATPSLDLSFRGDGGGA